MIYALKKILNVEYSINIYILNLIKILNFIVRILNNFPKVLFLISLTCLIYTYYRSEITWNGNFKEYYTLYYIIFITSLIISLLLIYQSRRIKILFSGLILSVLIALYFYEVFLIINLDYKNSKYFIYKKLKSEGKDPVLRISTRFYLDLPSSNIFPLSGPYNKLTVDCNEHGYTATYKSDRYGYNNPNNEWDNRINNFLLIGSSFAHGACINRKKDISANLRKLSNKSVLNLGYSGAGPLSNYASLKEYTLNKNFNNIIFLFYEGSSLNHLVNEIQNPILSEYLHNFTFSQNLKLKKKEIDKLHNQIETKNLNFLETQFNENRNLKFTLWKFIKLYNVRRINLNLKPIFTQHEFPEKEFIEIIEKIHEFAKLNNAKLHFVYLPSYWRYKDQFETYYNYNYKKVYELIKKEKINFIDINKQLFLKETLPLKNFVNEKPGHYTPNAYKKIADIILKNIN